MADDSDPDPGPDDAGGRLGEAVRPERVTDGSRRYVVWAFWGLLAVVFAVGPWFGDDYVLQILFLMLMWSGLATSWNILGGYTGYVSFGHGAFLALGGFTVGLAQQYLGIGQTFGVGLIGLLILAGIVPAVIAALVAYPFLRLHGGYFAIAMLGFQLTLGEAFTAFGFLGGGIGMPASLQDPGFLSAGMTLYYLMAAVVLLTVAVAHYIRTTEFGYGLFAIRENEDAAESLAIPTTRYKVIAFVLSAFFPGIIGGIYVYHLAFFTSGSLFNVLLTLQMIVYTVVGGLGTVAGPIIGSIVMTYLKNVLLIDISQAHVFFTGLFVVVVMLGFPRGVVGLAQDLWKGELDLPFRDR